MVSAQARRRQVTYARQRGVSSRRACALLSVARSTLGYEPRLAAKDAPVVAAMRELSAPYPRFVIFRRKEAGYFRRNGATERGPPGGSSLSVLGAVGNFAA